MRALAVVAVLALAGSAQAQIITDMTPARIAEAIALGTHGQDGAYRMGSKVQFWTPFSRVVQLSWLASKRYEKTDPGLFPGETLGQEIRVYAEDAEDNEPEEFVANIVLLPQGAKGPDQAIQPSRVEKTHGKGPDSGMLAHFPIEDWTEGAELLVIQENGHRHSHQIRLKGVR